MEGACGWHAAEDLGGPPRVVRGRGSNKAGQRTLRVQPTLPASGLGAGHCAANQMGWQAVDLHSHGEHWPRQFSIETHAVSRTSCKRMIALGRC